ncbi:response regulator [Oleiharenicola lentus]|uniref:response regulator n=1 Tax=Oleiharenicola lentus TaxID=2508720 RepID=UPI003F6707BE
MKTSAKTIRPILLVDDSANDIELTRSALEESGIANEVIIASDGVEALDFLFRRGTHSGRTTPDPAVVLLDLKMPRVDGHAVLKEIRADAKLRALPVVILTSSKEEQDLVRGYAQGTNAYVVKPVRFEDFLPAVKQLGVFWALLNEPPPGQ